MERPHHSNATAQGREVRGAVAGKTGEAGEAETKFSAFPVTLEP
jgi:hypothetical protein